MTGSTARVHTRRRSRRAGMTRSDDTTSENENEASAPSAGDTTLQSASAATTTSDAAPSDTAASDTATASASSTATATSTRGSTALCGEARTTKTTMSEEKVSLHFNITPIKEKCYVTQVTFHPG